MPAGSADWNSLMDERGKDVTKSDEQLGMGAPITRRDFVNGIAVTAAGAMLLPSMTLAQESVAPAETGKTGAQPGGQPGLETGFADEAYPPRRSGMRGSHPGSFEAAHQLRDNPREALASATSTGEEFDLIVVGAGMSGLSSAYFFVKNVGRDAKVLVLDNHDDFGGHAKRNEVVYNGKTLVINGGTLNIEAPTFYSEYAKGLLKDIGIDLTRYQKENEGNRQLYRSLGLKSAYFFDKETWGKDSLVINEGSGGEGRAITREFLDKTPLSEKAKADMLRLYDAKSAPDYFPELSDPDKRIKLAKMSYQDYLLNVVKVDMQVLWFFQHFGEGNFCVGADQTPALFAWEMGQPGFAGLKLAPLPDSVLDELPGTQHGRQKAARGGSVHFPDGNASIARLLVRWLIPDAVPGSTQEDLGTAQVKYDLLDRPNQCTRLRLGSTVLHARNEGAKGRETGVVLTYSKDGKLYNVKGKACVMACWNMMIPYMIPDLSAEQKKALAYATKGPLVYTNVAVKNWQAWKSAGVSNISAPSMYHTSVSLTEAVGLGDLQFPQSPDEPIFLHLTKVMTDPGKPRQDQHKAGRYQLLSTPFEAFERSIREQLDRMLGPCGFDAKRDIVSIIVNRWPHGYAYTYNGLNEPLEWVYTASAQRPCVIARQMHGLIAIANSDAGASPHTDTAMWEGHRAVNEILNRRAMPYLA
jgi:spermidine dehydrogenase